MTTKKMKIPSVQRSTVELDVEFPVFRKANYGGDAYDVDHFQRWDEDGTLWDISHSISFAGGGESWEIKEDRYSPHQNDDPDYILGRGEHELSADEFREAVEKARSFLDGIKV